MAKPGDNFYTDMRGIHAEGVVTENGFMVLKGSEVRDHEATYMAQALKDLRRDYLNVLISVLLWSSRTVATIRYKFNSV